ncbi:hypothetical protein N7470_005540 [Penicillium chermesinum]|nr:hypothetical protein N7470_005540 [Penicillium chermesinum]
MAEAPPIIFIARYVDPLKKKSPPSDLNRHGARLDAADKNWHLTSPTPYDPPLSYGGWIQSRALGVRIASLLEASEFTGNPPQAGSNKPSAGKATEDPQDSLTSDSSPRYNVIVHTSPYLRCVQTAIALSAGLKQARADNDVDKVSSTGRSTNSAGNLGPRTLLRVDAFLGEWLSPDYFDQIIPPPASDRMVASAKSELLRRDEIMTTPHRARRREVFIWSLPRRLGESIPPNIPQERDRNCGAEPVSTPTHYFQRQRASTVNTPQSPLPASKAPQALSQLDTNLESLAPASYVPPTPGYAVSASDPIPAGYVAHARDACTKIDYQWDSMRTPTWGNGGEFGEEWSIMQERVNDGFEKMLEWYEKPSNSRSSCVVPGSDSTENDSRPVQTVLIIVTHGADCNALINSLAGRPLLLDIGTASLTLSVPRDRLPGVEEGPEQMSDPTYQQNNTSTSRKYAMPLIASTDHLRAGVNPSQLTSLASPSAPKPSSQPSVSTYRRVGSRSAAIHSSLSLGPAPALGWAFMQRPVTSGSPSGASGLWGSISSPTDEDDEADNLVPNFRDSQPTSPDPPCPEPVVNMVNTTGWKNKQPQRTKSQRGLWGSAQSLEDREVGSRRRWTLAEQKL